MAASELARRDPLLLTQFSPRAVGSDGNCFYRAASLGLYGTEDHHYFLRARTALEIMNNRSLYDVDSPQFILPTGPSLTKNFRHVLRTSLTNGNYAELIHLFAMSAALNITVQSYCCPDEANVRDDGLHPYTIRICDNQFSHTMSSDQLVIMWTKTRINLREPNHFVLLAPRRQNAPPTSAPSPTAPLSSATVRSTSATTSAPLSSTDVNNDSPNSSGAHPGRKRKRCTERRKQQSMSPTSSPDAALNVSENIVSPTSDHRQRSTTVTLEVLNSSSMQGSMDSVTHMSLPMAESSRYETIAATQSGIGIF